MLTRSARQHLRIPARRKQQLVHNQSNRRKPTWFPRKDKQETAPAADASDVQLDAATPPGEFSHYTSLHFFYIHQIMHKVMLTSLQCACLEIFNRTKLLSTFLQCVCVCVCVCMCAFCISVPVPQPVNESGSHQVEANIIPSSVSDECAQACEPTLSLSTETFYKSCSIRNLLVTLTSTLS